MKGPLSAQQHGAYRRIGLELAKRPSERLARRIVLGVVAPRTIERDDANTFANLDAY